MVPYRHCRLDRQSLDRQSGEGRDARSESGMTSGKVRCPIGVGHDEEKRIPRKEDFRGMVGGYNFYDIS